MMSRQILPFLVFGATYLIVRFGLNLVEAQVWGRPAPGVQDPWIYLVKVVLAAVVAFGVTSLLMRGRWGRGGTGGV